MSWSLVGCGQWCVPWRAMASIEYSLQPGQPVCITVCTGGTIPNTCFGHFTHASIMHTSPPAGSLKHPSVLKVGASMMCIGLRFVMGLTCSRNTWVQDGRVLACSTGLSYAPHNCCVCSVVHVVQSCLKFVIHPYNPDLAEHHRSSCQRDSGTATEAPPKAPPPHSSSPPADTTNADDAEQEAAQADQVAAPADQAADIPSTGDAEQKAQADQVTEQLEGVSLGSDPDKEQ